MSREHGSGALCAATLPTTPFRPTSKPSATSAGMPFGTGIERFGAAASAGDERGGGCKHWRNDIFRRRRSCTRGRSNAFASDTARASIGYLDKPEMDALLAAPNRRSSQGQRDYVLILFLYNSGGRASEAALPRVEALN